MLVAVDMVSVFAACYASFLLKGCVDRCQDRARVRKAGAEAIAQAEAELQRRRIEGGPNAAVAVSAR